MASVQSSLQLLRDMRLAEIEAGLDTLDSGHAAQCAVRIRLFNTAVLEG